MNACELQCISTMINAANSRVKSPDSSLLDGSITTINDTETVTLCARALQGRTRLETATFAELTSLNNGNEFNGCAALQRLVVPKLVSITGSGVFSGCGSLKIIDFPALTRFSTVSGSFQEVTLGASDITKVFFAKLTTLEKITITNGTALGSQYSPATLNFASNCMSLNTIIAPELTITATANNEGSFTGCTALVKITKTQEATGGYFPKLSNVAGSTFKGCNALATVTLPNANTLGTNVFNGCVSLEYLELGGLGSAVVSIGSGSLTNVPPTCQIKIYTANGQPLTTAENPWGWAGSVSNITWLQA